MLFYDKGGTENRALHYLNNHVNCVINGNKALTALSFGPVVTHLGSTGNIIAHYVEKSFTLAGLTALTADDRVYYSNFSGSFHCGTAVERTIPDFKWWEK